MRLKNAITALAVATAVSACAAGGGAEKPSPDRTAPVAEIHEPSIHVELQHQQPAVEIVRSAPAPQYLVSGLWEWSQLPPITIGAEGDLRDQQQQEKKDARD